MGIGKLINDFSWDTLMSLPPSEFLSLLGILLFPVLCLALLVWFVVTLENNR
jgi:hypothetical protein